MLRHSIFLTYESMNEKKSKKKIEEYTSDFTDPKNAYSRFPHIKDILIQRDQPSALEYI